MIQPRGIGVALVALALLFLGGTTRIGWLLLFDAVLWGVLLVSAAMPWLTIGRPSVRRAVAIGSTGTGPGPMEGDEVELSLRVLNWGLLPAVFVSIDIGSGGEPVRPRKTGLFVAYLGSGKSLSAKASVRYPRRGLHTMRPVVVETRAPFGFFRRSKRSKDTDQVLVLPRVYPMGAFALRSHASEAVETPILARTGELLVGSRAYSPGDPLYQVHWRNTARTDHVQVKEFQRESDQGLVLPLRSRLPAEEGMGPVDHAVRLAASVGDAAIRSGRGVTLLLGGSPECFVDRRPFLERLALIEDEAYEDVVPLLNALPPASTVVAIVPRTDVAALEAVWRLETRWGRVALLVLHGRGESWEAEGSAKSPEPGRVPVIDCHPDDIPAALARLDLALDPSGHPARTTALQS